MKRWASLSAVVAALLALPSSAAAGHGSWFIWLGVSEWNDHIVTSVFLLILLTAMALRIGAQAREDMVAGRFVPAPRFSLRNLVEIAVEGIVGMMKGVFGDGYRRFFPIIGALAFYIMVCNLIGLVPGFLPPTADINTTASMAVPVFLLTHYYGVKSHGPIAYLKHFMGPLLVLAPLIFVVELIGHLARPLSLSLRLFGNMTGDHEVVGRFSDLVPLGVPIPFMAFGILVCFIQTFVFILLTMIYFSMAVAHEEEHGEGHGHSH